MDLLKKFIINDNNNNNINIFNDKIKNILMYYQTTLRNVGLYTTLSISIFTLSRFFKNYYSYQSLFLRLLSFIILIVAILICKFLLDDVFILFKDYSNNYKNHEVVTLEKWSNLLFFIYFVLTLILLIFITTFIYDLNNNKLFKHIVHIK